jgi:subtilisin family serine protease
MADSFFTYDVSGKTRRLTVANDVRAVRRFAAFSPVAAEVPLPDGTRRRASPQPQSRLVWFDSYTILPTTSAPDAQTRSPDAGGGAEGEFATPPGAAKPHVFKEGDTYLIAADQLIVSTQNNADLDAAWLTKYDLDLVVRRQAFHVVRLRSGQDPFDAMTILSRDAKVSFAEPDFALVMTGLMLDPFVPDAFDAHVSDQHALQTTNCQAAWQILEDEGRQGDVTIAIIDDGIDIRHPDLAEKITTSDVKDFTTNQHVRGHDGHGTACAGLAAAAGPDTGIGVRGAGFGSKLCSARVAWTDHPGDPMQTTHASIAAAIKWAVDTVGARVISLSFGAGIESTEIQSALDLAEANEVVVVAAAGNKGVGGVEFPARVETVLAVAAVNLDKAPASGPDWGSTPGPEVDIAAPGVGMLTTDRMDGEGYNAEGNYTRTFSRTSAATPIVAGVCALVIAANPSLSAKNVRDIVTTTAQPIDGLGPGEWNDRVGYGLVDAEEAVKKAITLRDAVA